MQRRTIIFLMVFQGLWELGGLTAFLLGYFGEIEWLMILGGILLVLEYGIEILWGILNPIVPIILWIVSAIIFKPWYVGIFWVCAVFTALNIPGNLIKIFAPHKLIEKDGKQSFW